MTMNVFVPRNIFPIVQNRSYMAISSGERVPMNLSRFL